MSEANETLRRFRQANDRFQQDLGVHNDRLKELDGINANIAAMTRAMEVSKLSLTLLEAVAVGAQEIVQKRIDEPVTTALRTIYQDQRYGFKTVMDRVGDRMEVGFQFSRGDVEPGGPIEDSTGGGFIDVAGFTLRLCIFRLRGGTGAMVLDEPFRHVDRDALTRAAEFVHRVSNDMGIQIVAITHESEIALQSDNIIWVKGLGKIEQVSPEQLDELLETGIRAGYLNK